MSRMWCTQYCRNYGDCSGIIWAFKSYEKKYGKKSPIERQFFSERDVPACFQPYSREKGDGGTNS
jgi:hypothetical protein